MIGRRRFLTAAVGTMASLVACSAGRRPPPDALDVAGFGAAGDGVTDDSRALQTACDRAAGRRAVSLAGRRYLVGDVVLRSGTTIVGPGTLVFRPGARHALSVNPGTGGTADPSQNVRDILLDGIAFEGRSRDGFREYDYQLWLSAASDVTVRNCRFEAFQGDGIMIGSGEQAGVERHNERISIVGCRFDGVNRQNRNAISVIDVRGLEIRGCDFRRCTRPDMPGPIDIEPNVQDRTAVLADIEIVDNVFADNGGNVANVSLAIIPPVLDRPLDGLTIRRNTFSGFARTAVRLAWEGHDPNTSDTDARTVVAQNTVRGESGLFFCEIYGLRGVTVQENHVSAVPKAGVVCGRSDAGCADVSIGGNDWDGVGGDFQAIVLATRCDRVSVTENSVTGPTAATLVQLSERGTSSQLRVTDNPLPDTMSVAELGPGHRTTPALNLAARNGAATVDPAVFASPGPPS